MCFCWHFILITLRVLRVRRQGKC